MWLVEVECRCGGSCARAGSAVDQDWSLSVQELRMLALVCLDNFFCQFNSVKFMSTK